MWSCYVTTNRRCFFAISTRVRLNSRTIGGKSVIGFGTATRPASASNLSRCFCLSVPHWMRFLNVFLSLAMISIGMIMLLSFALFKVDSMARLFCAVLLFEACSFNAVRLI